MDKLKEMITEANIEPKDRHMWLEIGGKAKEIRKKEKKFRSEIKRIRSSKHSDFFD